MGLIKVIVLAAEFIKKQLYWPRHVPGQEIDHYIKTKNNGDVTSLQGEIDKYNYDIFSVKKSEYKIKSMSTYGGLTVKNRQNNQKNHKDNRGVGMGGIPLPELRHQAS